MFSMERQVSILLAVLTVGACVLGGVVAAAFVWPEGMAAMGTIGLVASLAALVLAARIRRRLSDALSKTRKVLGVAVRTESEPPTDVAALPDALAETFTEIERRSREYEQSRDYLERVLSGMNETVFVVDAMDRIEFANDAAGALTGRPRETLIGIRIDDVLNLNVKTAARSQSESMPIETELTRADGGKICVSYTKSELRDEHGSFRSAVYAARNIDERKRTEQRIRELASTDPLTKIANRMEIQHQLQQSIAHANSHDQYLALLYLDLDRFKDINDTFGHAAGDRSLELFANRIVDILPQNAVAGRLAGDEFCVLLPPRSGIEELVAEVNSIAQELLRAVARPFPVQGEQIFMTTSAGVTIYPRDADNMVDLLRNADAAMYYAKRAGGNCYEIYERDMRSPAEERLKLKSKLSRAFERQELRLRYQPKYRLVDGQVAGAEALVRWNLPDRGLILPSQFIPLAEESNLIVQIGDWVLDRVCADYRQWQRVIPSPRRISVNLSLRQLQQHRFLENVRKTFRRHSVSPTCLELEITETTLMEDMEATSKILDALYGMGLNLAIDDFGTGYSSLSALQQFPINTLKIDQSFLRDISIDRDNAAIVRAIIEMAHSLKLEVVAEGVETHDQLVFLRKHGCDYAQGHLFGDPMTASEFATTLADDADGSGKYRALFA